MMIIYMYMRMCILHGRKGKQTDGNQNFSGSTGTVCTSELRLHDQYVPR